MDSGKIDLEKVDLRKLYNDIKERIDTVDFSKLWRGFTPFSFALYDEERCFFNGEYIQKTADFIANTSIVYKGEYIAIWNIDLPVDVDILASKIIHEMFHAYQMANGESRFPKELEAICRYCYSVENLSIKLAENQLLSGLVSRFDKKNWDTFLQLRKYRLSRFTYEYQYEAAVEQIEGTANFVELEALRQISVQKYEAAIKAMQRRITEIKNLMPVRIISYSIGALLFLVMKHNRILDFQEFSSITIGEEMLNGVSEYNSKWQADHDIERLIFGYNQETEEIIKGAIKKGQCVAEGEYDLLGLNIYDARCWNEYIVSTCFVMFGKDGEETVLNGDFVIEYREGKVIRIYEID